MKMYIFDTETSVCRKICMHSVVDLAFFCVNYCMNLQWRGGDQTLALLMRSGPGCFNGNLQLICNVF